MQPPLETLPFQNFFCSICSIGQLASSWILSAQKQIFPSGVWHIARYSSSLYRAYSWPEINSPKLFSHQFYFCHILRGRITSGSSSWLTLTHLKTILFPIILFFFQPKYANIPQLFLTVFAIFLSLFFFQ
jgi:hypothetical protein